MKAWMKEAFREMRVHVKQMQDAGRSQPNKEDQERMMRWSEGVMEKLADSPGPEDQITFAAFNFLMLGQTTPERVREAIEEAVRAAAGVASA